VKQLLTHDTPLIAAMLGHALISPAENLRKQSKYSSPRSTRQSKSVAWYQLGIVYDREGDQPRASLATAERSNLEGNPKMALASAEMALRGIPQGTPDYLRAQDIAMVSKTELRKDRKYRERDDREQK
jgi:predicted Zn-dependent protease